MPTSVVTTMTTISSGPPRRISAGCRTKKDGTKYVVLPRHIDCRLPMPKMKLGIAPSTNTDRCCRLRRTSCRSAAVWRAAGPRGPCARRGPRSARTGRNTTAATGSARRATTSDHGMPGNATITNAVAPMIGSISPRPVDAAGFDAARARGRETDVLHRGDRQGAAGERVRHHAARDRPSSVRRHRRLLRRDERARPNPVAAARRACRTQDPTRCGTSTRKLVKARCVTDLYRRSAAMSPGAGRSLTCLPVCCPRRSAIPRLPLPTADRRTAIRRHSNRCRPAS